MRALSALPRTLAAIAGACVFLTIGSPAGADVVMPPPPHHGDISMDLQQEANRRFGTKAAQAMFLSLSAVAVAGDYGPARSRPVTVLIREQEGWARLAPRGARITLGPAQGAELDRILASAAFWQEDGFVYGQPCPGPGRRMIVLHRGRDKVTRQLCGPAGLVGRLAEVAATGRVPPGRILGDAELAAQERDSAAFVRYLANRTAAAWNQGNLDIYLSAYAPDVTLITPSGRDQGKDVVRRRAIAARPWTGPAPRQLSTQAETIRHDAPDRIVHRLQYQVHDGAVVDRFTEYWVTSTWQKRNGKWAIVREETEPEMVRRWD